VPGRVQYPPPDGIEMVLQHGEHVQGRGDLQLPGRRQLRRGDRPQRGQALAGAQALAAELPGALVKQHRVHALDQAVCSVRRS